GRVRLGCGHRLGFVSDGAVVRPHPRRPLRLRRTGAPAATQPRRPRDPRRRFRPALAGGRAFAARAGAGAGTAGGRPLAVRRTCPPAHRAGAARPAAGAGGHRRGEGHAADLRLASVVPPAGTAGVLAHRDVAVPRDRLRKRGGTGGQWALPLTSGRHPWFRKPDRLEYSPTAMYPRDESHVATLPLVPPGPGPWDDCFVNTAPVVLHRAGQVLRLTSGCDHWVVYDGTAHATCVEPQTGPADAFNLGSPELQPGQEASAWYRMEWD